MNGTELFVLEVKEGLMAALALGLIWVAVFVIYFGLYKLK